jgi:predicted enzyme involved in methoxymalonyl-ACP biosynthesis
MQAVGPPDGTVRLENLAISCRALGRNLETAFLYHLLARCKNAGLDCLQALWRRLPRNQQTESFFPKHGFRPVSGDSEHGTIYAFELQANPLPEPSASLQVEIHIRA